MDDEGVARLADGRLLRARHIVIAAGNASATLLPGLPLKPRKGQLLITERYPQRIRHQLVELGYIRSAHAAMAIPSHSMSSPRHRPVADWFVPPVHDTDPAINWPLLQAMLSRALEYLPSLRQLQALRSWAGFRPATPDKLPLLGKVPGHSRLWLATGHEGLGITTALASAHLLADLLCEQAPALDPTPYNPSRFGPWSLADQHHPVGVAA